MLLLSRDPDDWVGWLVRCQEPEYLMGWIVQQGGKCGRESLGSLIKVGVSGLPRCIQAGSIPQRILEKSAMSNIFNYRGARDETLTVHELESRKD